MKVERKSCTIEPSGRAHEVKIVLEWIIVVLVCHLKLTFVKFDQTSLVGLPWVCCCLKLWCLDRLARISTSPLIPTTFLQHSYRVTLLTKALTDWKKLPSISYLN